VFDANRGVKVFGKFARDLFYQPVLDRGGLNGQPYQYDQSDQYQQDGPAYFPKLSQGWSVLNVKVIKQLSLFRKIGTNGLFLCNFPVHLTLFKTPKGLTAVLYIRKKVMKATTDQGPKEPNSPKPDYIENLFLLMKLVSAPDVIKKFEEDYNTCTIRYGDMKKQLAEDMVRFIAPIREKAEGIQQDKEYLKKVMVMGAEKARVSAKATLDIVCQAMGLNYY